MLEYMTVFGGCILMSLNQQSKNENIISSSLIGKYQFSNYSYYNVRTGRMEFKYRPMLIIGAERPTLPCDLTVLPVSKISHSRHIHAEFDYKLSKAEFEKCNLTYDPSYIRTHKIATISSSDLSTNKPSVDFAREYPEKYEEIAELYQKFSNKLFK